VRKARGLVRILGEREGPLGVVPDPEIGPIQKAISALHKVERRVCTMSDLEECRERYGNGQMCARYMHRNGLLEGEALF
jgi:hypothetical protein